tara:strand:+ start:8080 stop:8313 length:234 start_codon:yes stop_codon:yes gene_type:complete
MKVLTWFRKDWKLTHDAHAVLRFMSVQASFLLAVIPAIFTAYGFPFWVSMGSAAVLFGTVALGAVIKQDEIDNAPSA